MRDGVVRIEIREAPELRVALRDTTAYGSSTVFVPVELLDTATDQNILQVEMQIGYDPDVVSSISARTGSVPDDSWTLAQEGVAADSLRITMSSSERPLSCSCLSQLSDLVGIVRRY